MIQVCAEISVSENDILSRMKTHRIKILLAEDNDEQSSELLRFLDEETYDITRTEYGRDAVMLLKSKDYDVLILDLYLRDNMSGLEVIGLMHRLQPKLAIIAVTGQGGDNVVGQCLDLGALYCLAKPISRSTLNSTIRRALESCSYVNPGQVMDSGSVHFDFRKRIAEYDGTKIHLTRLESFLLRALMEKPGQVVTHKRLKEACWGNSEINSNTLDRLAVRLRDQFMKAGALDDAIKNDKGGGYAITI